MTVSVGKLVFLIVPGFLYVNGNLLMDDSLPMGPMIMDAQLQTTRPPHRIFFIESGNRVERVVDDEFMPMPPMLPTIPEFNSPGLGGREAPSQNSTTLNPASRGFNANKGDDSKFSIEDSETEEFPSLLLTPQRFFHIKVAVPKAYYTTRLYPGPSGDVDIVEIRSIGQASMMAKRNSGLDMKSSLQMQSGLNTNNNPNIQSFASQAQTSGWQNSPMSSISIGRTANDIRTNQPSENSVSPYGGSSPYSLGNNIPINFNRVSDDSVANSPYGSPGRGLSVGSQNYPSSGPLSLSGTQNSQQVFGANSPYGSPKVSPAAVERGVDSQVYQQNELQAFRGAQNIPQFIMSGQTSQQMFQGEASIPQSFPGSPSSPQSVQGAQSAPQPYQGSLSFSGSLSGPQPVQGVQSIPQPYQGSHSFPGSLVSPQTMQGVQNVQQPYQGSHSFPGSLVSPQTMQGVQNVQQPYQGSQSFSGSESSMPQSFQGSQPVQGDQNVLQTFQGSHSMSGIPSNQQLLQPSSNSAAQFQGLRNSPQSTQEVQNVPQPYQGDQNTHQPIQGVQSSVQQSHTDQNVPQQFQGIQSGQESVQRSYTGPQLSQGGHQMTQLNNQISNQSPNPTPSGGVYDQYKGNPMQSHSLFTTTRYGQSLLPSSPTAPDARDAHRKNMQTLLNAVRSLDDGS